MKNISMVVNVTFYWNDEPENEITRECYIGVYDEDMPDIDSFYWFEDEAEIVGDHGDFTVVSYEVVKG